MVATMSPSVGAAPQTSPRELNLAEKWVVDKVTAGELADLDAALNADQTKKFPEEKDRKLGARFVEDLLMGTLPGVKIHRYGVRISGASIDEPVDLTNAQIPCEVRLAHCQFNASVTFDRASFPVSALFDNSVFKANASFNSMNVKHDVFFRRAVFEGSVDFDRAIVEDFFADDARFSNTERGVTFNDMKARNASFQKAVFEGSVDFTGAGIAGSFTADEVEFKNEEKEADFNRMKARDASFEKAVFEGPVNFIGADLTAELNMKEAHFKNKEKGADFSTMNVGDVAVFEEALLEGPISFADSSFLDLIIGDVERDACAVPKLDLSRSVIKRELRVQRIRIIDLIAPWLHVEGPADFTGLTVEHSADLSDDDFTTLDLTGSGWPTEPEAFQMQRMSYKYLNADSDESESHHTLLNLIDRAAYSADMYGKLETFFSRQGYAEDADRAFIAGKRRERQEFLHGIRSFGSLLLDWLVGYGRRPWQAGIPCAVLVALGCVLFSPKKMEPQKPEDAARVYSRFWYSLGLFLPFVDLQAHKVWKPKADQTFLRNYMRVHILLGWILIPILLAALSGLIK